MIIAVKPRSKVFLCSRLEFTKLGPALQGAVAIDFSEKLLTQGRFRQLATYTKFPMRDILEVLAAYGAQGVYEPTPVYRERTLERADDWLRLADRLADDVSDSVPERGVRIVIPGRLGSRSANHGGKPCRLSFIQRLQSL